MGDFVPFEDNFDCNEPVQPPKNQNAYNPFAFFFYFRSVSAIEGMNEFCNLVSILKT
jgi:hypothetical protein